MRRTVKTLAAICIMIGPCACTAPTPHHPIVGTYDVTTVLDSFSFETPAPSPPDCPYGSGSLYCTHYRAYSGATLSGVLTVGDSTMSWDGRPLFLAKGAFGGLFCDSMDGGGPTGCLHAGEVAPQLYPAGGLVLSSSFATDSGFSGGVDVFVSTPTTGTNNSPMISLTGTLAGDSLFGRVSWVLHPYRSPPTHWGRFVARRRR